MADGFLIPNRPDTGYSADQTEPDKGDFQALGYQKSGILSGGAVTRSNVREVSITETKGWLNGNFFTASAATKSFSAPSTSASKFILIVVRYSGGSYGIEAIEGTSGNTGESTTNTRYPDTFDPATEVLLAAIYMNVSATDISATSLVDKRVMVMPQANPTTVTSTPTSSDGNIGEIRIDSSMTPSSGQSRIYVKTDATTWTNLGDASGGSVNSEDVQDIVGAQLVTNGSHNGITAAYDDAGDGAIDLTVTALSWNLTAAGSTENIGNNETMAVNVSSDAEVSISHSNGTITINDAWPRIRTMTHNTLGNTKPAHYIYSDPWGQTSPGFGGPSGTGQFIYTRLQVADLNPMVNNTHECGNSSYKWNYSWVHNTSYASSFSGWSDRNLKKNFGSAPGLAFVRGLAPLSFTWKDPDLGDSWGFVAQDVEALCGTHSLTSEILVDTVDDGTKYLNYMALLAPVVNAVQELDVRISNVQVSEGLTVSNLEEQIAGSKTQSQSAVDYIDDFDAKQLAKQPQVDQDRADIADLKTRVAALEAAASG
jgi:hypothetical protein